MMPVTDSACDESGRRLLIDRTLCEGHARCVMAAPDLFEVGDDDQAHFLITLIGREELDAADMAVGECPRGALTWIAEAKDGR